MAAMALLTMLGFTPVTALWGGTIIGVYLALATMHSTIEFAVYLTSVQRKMIRAFTTAFKKAFKKVGEVSNKIKTSTVEIAMDTVHATQTAAAYTRAAARRAATNVKHVFRSRKPSGLLLTCS